MLLRNDYKKQFNIVEPSPTPFDLPRPPEGTLTGARRTSDQGESVCKEQLEARLADLQRELEAARLAESSARQELEDQRAAFLEESSSAQRLAQAEAEAQRALAKQDSAVLGARLQELQDSADAARDEQEKRHSALAQANADRDEPSWPPRGAR